MQHGPEINNRDIMPKPTKTKTNTAIDNLGQPKPDQPLTAPKVDRPPQPPRAPTIRRASSATTRQRTQNITPTDQMRDMLGRMRDLEPDPHDPGYPARDMQIDQPTMPENLPAVINSAITAAGFQNPDWHVVANLPGNMSQGIRTLGRRLFGSLTRTPTDDIVMIGNIMGMGPNTSQEINAVVGWLRANGQQLASGDIDFDRVMPGYVADIVQYSAAGARFLLVRDDFGQYIYTWPESDSVNSTAARQIGRP